MDVQSGIAGVSIVTIPAKAMIDDVIFQSFNLGID